MQGIQVGAFDEPEKPRPAMISVNNLEVKADLESPPKEANLLNISIEPISKMQSLGVNLDPQPIEQSASMQSPAPVEKNSSLFAPIEVTPMQKVQS